MIGESNAKGTSWQPDEQANMGVSPKFPCRGISEDPSSMRNHHMVASIYAVTPTRDPEFCETPYTPRSLSEQLVWKTPLPA